MSSRNRLTLKDLPAPPGGKTGWPWTEESQELPDLMPNGRPWPKISIVTPNYNYGNFIEETIRSVLLQGYPNLEYIIMDGGSDDNSVEIIRKYESFLAFFVTKPDKGQTQSINEGFSHATGDIFAWINSDDVYCKDVFSYVAEKYKEADIKRFWLVMAVDYFTPEENVSRVETQDPTHSLVDWTIGKVTTNQQGAFWARDIWGAEGLLDESMQYAFDMEFFVKLISRGYSFKISDKTAARFRLHSACKIRTQRLRCQHERARIALKYLPENYRNYAAEKRRLLGTLANIHMRLSRDSMKPFFNRILDLFKMLWYKLLAFFQRGFMERILRSERGTRNDA